MRLAALLLVLAPSQDPPRPAHDLVERLRSARGEEREEAARKIKGLGREAIPELEKAARDGDVDFAFRAARLLRTIEIAQTLTPHLMKEMPGVEERLAAGLRHAWIEVFLDARHSDDSGRRRYPRLKRDDFRGLAAGALRGADGPGEKCDILRSLGWMRLRSAVPEVVRMLDDEDASVRIEAMEVLADMGAGEAGPAIRRLLGDKDRVARSYAARAVARLDAREGIPDLVGFLRETDLNTRQAGVEALVHMRALEAVPSLVGLLKGEDDYVRDASLNVLARMGVREALPHLLSILREGKREDRPMALMNLGLLRAREAVPAVVECLSVEDLRESACHAIVNLRAREAVPALVGLLHHKEEQLRSRALWTLESIDAREAAGEIAKLLAEESFICLEAQRILLQWKPKDVVPQLLDLVRGEKYRHSAFSVLSALEARPAAPEAARFLASDDVSVLSGAIVMVGRLGGKESVPAIARFLSHKEDFIAAHAARALGQMGADGHVPDLRKLLKDEREYVRREAAEALGILRAKSAVPDLVRLLDDERSEVRGSAMSALAQLGAREAVPRLIGILKDGSPEDREGALQALIDLDAREAIPAMVASLRRCGDGGGLAKMRAREAIPLLLKLLEHETREVRVVAIEVLGMLGAREAVPRIVPFLSEVEGDLREAAAVSLCRLGSREGVPLLIEEGGDLSALNALRCPDAWNRLGGAMRQGRCYGTSEDLVGEVAREARMAVEGPGDVEGDDGAWSRDRRMVGLGWDGTLLEAVRGAVGFPFTFILEPDRIRIVRREEALRFWKDWWEERRRKG